MTSGQFEEALLGKKLSAVKLKEFLTEALVHHLGDFSIETLERLRDIADSGVGEVSLYARVLIFRHRSDPLLAEILKGSLPELFFRLDKIEDIPIDRGIYYLSEVLSRRRVNDLSELIGYLKKTKNNYYQSYLVKFLPQIYADESIKMALIPFLNHSDERIIANTLEGLSAINDDSLFPIFEPYVNHGSCRVKASCIKALRKIRPGRAITLLKKMLDSTNSGLVRSGVAVVKELEEEELYYLLDPLRDHPEVGNEVLKILSTQVVSIS